MNNVEKYPWRNPEVLDSLYNEDGMTQAEIADELGCSESCVGNWMSNHGIETGCVKTGEDRPWTNESELRELLHNNGLDLSEAGDRLGCSEDTVAYWRDKYNISKHPPITDYQHQLITGALMGDASVTETPGNPKFVLSNTNVEFLWWFFEQTLNILNEPHQVRTVEETARQNGGCVDENSAYYALGAAHPEFEQYREWYSSGSKRFPCSLTLTPVITKVWYACDGSLINLDSGSISATFGVANEMDREDYLLSLFQDEGFDPVLHNWTLRFGVDETQELLDWMGKPPSGFKQKWGE